MEKVPEIVRKIAFNKGWLSALWLFPLLSQAVGLGELKVNSHLNERLEAQIELKAIGKLAVSDLRVQMADPNTFLQYALESPSWAAQIQFEIVKSERTGNYLIKLSTEQPIKDPFADLLIEVLWPAGNLQKEYMLLLDPPKIAHAGYQEKRYYPTFQPQIPLPKKTSSQASTASAVPSSNQIAFGAKYGPVKNQTLWRIAKNLVSDTGLTVQQGMMAIANKNPDIFKDGNIHTIMEGRVLLMPTKEEAQTYSQESALRFVQSQDSGRKQVTSHTVADNHADNHAGDQADNAIAKPFIQSQETGLKLVDPLVKSTQTEGPSNPGQVTQRLALIEEAIDTLQRNNEAITQKNHALEEQNKNLLSQLALKNQEIDDLRSADKTAVAVAVSQSAATETKGSPTTYADLGLAAKPANVARSPKPAPGITPPPVRPQQGLSWLFMVLIGVCGMATVWFSRHRLAGIREQWRDWRVRSNHRSGKPDARDSVQENVPPPPHQGTEKEIIFDRFVARPTKSMSFNLDKALAAVVEESKQLTKPLAESSKKESNFEEIEHNKLSASLEDADIYIAYERYAQAEKSLQAILEAHPLHLEAWLKLLELYVLTEKYKEFEETQALLPKDFENEDPKIAAKIMSLIEKVKSEKTFPELLTSTEEGPPPPAVKKSVLVLDKIEPVVPPENTEDN